MKTIGLLGGTSWQSTADYYRIINERTHKNRGGQHSAKIILNSLDFDEFVERMLVEKWDEVLEMLLVGVSQLERGGADFFLLCTNTMHKVAPELERRSCIPMLHIVDATISEIKSQEFASVGLLGTKFVMEQDFYRERLAAQGISVVVPHAEDRQLVHKTIFHELCHGKVTIESKIEFQRIIANLSQEGAEGVVLGCTEIGMLISQSEVQTPLFDTTRIHAEMAVEMAYEPGD